MNDSIFFNMTNATGIPQAADCTQIAEQFLNKLSAPMGLFIVVAALCALALVFLVKLPVTNKYWMKMRGKPLYELDDKRFFAWVERIAFFNLIAITFLVELYLYGQGIHLFG